METQELKVREARNIHHISPAPHLQPYIHNQQSTLRPRSSQAPRIEVFDFHFGIKLFLLNFFFKGLSSKIDTIITGERDLLEKDLDGYKTTTGKKLENFLMEKRGNPVRAMVVTTWRSGSTFLGKPELSKAVVGGLLGMEISS